MGRIAVMIGGIEAEKTPLERRMDVFGSQVAKVIFAIALVVTVAGLSVEGWARMGHVFLFAVALAVAAVPEGLPAVLTITLASASNACPSERPWSADSAPWRHSARSL